MQPRAKSQRSKADELARVRNNQRRCRERRQNYITELEGKVKRLESADDGQISEQSSDHCQRENEALRRLLASLGLETTFVNTYLEAAKGAPTVFHAPPSQQVPLSGTQVSPPSWTSDMFNHDSSNSLQKHSMLDDPFNYTSTLFDIPDPFLEIPIHTSSTSLDPPCTSSQSSQYLAPSAVTDSLDALLHPVTEGTTLCSVAYSLVSKHNKNGYDFAQLDLRLQVGYTGRSICDSCTVDNKVLFRVLAEIS